jgi:D-alanyl-D-alanine carboxypeptidase/D-alanyl-D-alanine-endopeptidase (penicillin-binding protein 4)
MKKSLIFFCLFFVTSTAFAALPTSVADALKNAGIAQENVAVLVQPLDAELPVIAHNPSKSMNPASVMKLVTSYAALEALTPAYRWKTEVFRHGPINNGVLEGDLIIKGYGDPSFKAQDFWRLLMTVQQAGIQKINGNLVIDKSVFAEEVSQRVSFDDETWRAYNAMPSAFLVNGRSTSFKFSVQEGKVKVDQEFELPEIQIVNQMKLRQNGCGDWRNYFSYTVLQKNGGVEVTFTGSYSPECEERYIELSVLSDTQYAFYTFKKIWAQLGGQFNGQLQITSVPLTAQKITTQYSEPLSQVMHDINKWSNNLMARQLMLTVGLVLGGAMPATEKSAATAIKEVLARKGLFFDELVIENGSGLSRMERISAEHLAQLLVRAFKSSVMPDFMASLPILGLDGTTKKRLSDTSLLGRAQLKTGSLNGVTTIAGYLLDANSRRYAVVFLINHPNAALGRKAQDALLEAIDSGRY